MPESKTRHHHHQHHPHDAAPGHAKPKSTGRAVIVAIVFFTLLGIGISYFIAGDGLLALSCGAVLGALSGYLFGHQIDKTLSKK